MDTLQTFFSEKIGSVSSGFTDLLTIRETSGGYQEWKIAKATESSSGTRKSYRNFHKKNEGKSIVVSKKGHLVICNNTMINHI